MPRGTVGHGIEKETRLTPANPLGNRAPNKCACGKRWTPFELPPECDCSPSYFVVVRDGRRNHTERVGKNRRAAERALRKVDVAVDDGVFEPRLDIRFEVWGPRWRESLERKDTTKDGYRETIRLRGGRVRVQVRRLRPAHLAKLNEHMKKRSCRRRRGRSISVSSTPVCRRRWSTATP